MSESVLSVRDLRVCFDTNRGVARAVDGVSIELGESETLALVGESGCGKSITALSILGLLPRGARILDGSEVKFRGESLLLSSDRRMREIRGNEIAMVFQEPMTSLNPVLRIGRQVAEAILAHEDVSRRSARDRAVDLLARVGLPDPAASADSWPHELSGGMRQRAMIAIALACDPAVLIADEPTTALDVTMQAQILELLATLQSDTGLSVLIVTHDLGVAARVADGIAVMYAGQIVEQGVAAAVLSAPRHPYTEALIASVPPIERTVDRLPAIPGVVPSAGDWPAGCRFEPRCGLAFDRCAAEAPGLEDGLRCWLDR